ncbi:MAG: hypothetical protein EON88_23545, partial [Brevundimonas sp.]
MHWVQIAAATLLATAVSAPADPAPPEGLAWKILSDLNAPYDDPSDPTNRPAVIREIPEGVITAVQINDDGKPDWLVRYPEEGWFCGTGGCETALYVSADEGYSRALDRQLLTVKVNPSAGVALEAQVHHLNCNDDPMDCLVAWRWDERSRQLIPVPSSDGRGLLSGGGVAVVDDGDAGQGSADPWWPHAIEAAWRESRLVCIADYEPGYTIRHSVVLAAPDLDGDGATDWIVQRPGPCDAGFDTTPELWATRGEDAVRI